MNVTELEAILGPSRRASPTSFERMPLRDRRTIPQSLLLLG
jgi:hypothetical protein